MLNRSSCTLYELFDASWNSGHPTAGSGAIFNLGSNALRPAGWTSADAAGLPMLPGLVRLDEVRSGAIHHALRFTASAPTAPTSGRPGTRLGLRATQVCRPWARAFD